MSRHDAPLDLVAVFDHPSAANDAANALVDAGVDRSAVRVFAGASEEVLRRQRLADPDTVPRDLMPPENGMALGFVAGFLGGGFLGLVMGSGAINVMGKEAAMAAGPFWAAAIGALVLGAAGAIAGFVVNAPLPRLEPPHAAAEPRVDTTIVQASVPSARAAEALDVLARHRATDSRLWVREGNSWTPRSTPAS